MLFIIDNNLLDLDNHLYDIFINCIEKLDIKIFNILIIDVDLYCYYENYIYDVKNFYVFMENKKKITYNALDKIMNSKEIYCFYQEDFDNGYEKVIFDVDNYRCNYFNDYLRNVCIFYFLNNSSNYYKKELNIEYSNSRLLNVDCIKCSKNMYIINQYHRDVPFRYITNCIHKINHISYENNIFKKDKKYFLSSYIKKYVNWLKLNSFEKYELLDIMFHSLSIIIYISYYEIFKIYDLISIFENIFDNEQYNYALITYLNNHYLNIDNKYKNISILLNFKIFIIYFYSYYEINKNIYNKNTNSSINNKYYKSCHIFQIKNTEKKNDINSDYQVLLLIKNKYPYVLHLVNKNICVAGGFLRSMILNQKVNDIDFFIHGIIDNYFILIDNFLQVICNYFINCYIIQLYKPENKVLEYIIVNSINEIVIKIQLILVSHKDISSLMSSFDLNPCKIAYDGNSIIYTTESTEAYKYLINDIRNINITHCCNVDYRIKKYLNYGFDLVVNNNKNIKIKKNTIIKLSTNIIANVININNDIIEIEIISNNIIENKKDIPIHINKIYTSLCIDNKDICDLINMHEIYGTVNIRNIDIIYFVIANDKMYPIKCEIKEEFINKVIDKSGIYK